jgi:hypothetical protein
VRPDALDDAGRDLGRLSRAPIVEEQLSLERFGGEERSKYARPVLNEDLVAIQHLEMVLDSRAHPSDPLGGLISINAEVVTAKIGLFPAVA